MKKILVMAMVAMTMVACATKKDEPQKTAAQQLLERLDSLQQKGIMYGESCMGIKMIRCMDLHGNMTKTPAM